MNGKRYMIAVMALALLLVIQGMSSAQYSDEITDPRGDVSHWRVTETGYGWRHNVERSDVDIRETRIREETGEIIVSLQVEGNIRSEENFWYHIYLEDEEEETYSIHFEAGNCLLYSPYYYSNLIEFSGVGTNTFQTSFSLEDVGQPSTLSIVEVYAWEWMETDETGEYYWDTAGPEADDPTDGNGDTDEDVEEGLGDLFDMGRTCMLITIIVVVIIVIIIIIVLIKFLKKDDEEKPPQQQYQQQPSQEYQQQPPQQPPSPPEQQYQQPPPPSEPETKGEIGDEPSEDW